MDYKTKRLHSALDDAKMVCDELNIPFGDIKRVKINTRAKSRWGQCKKLKTGGYEIEIADMLLDPHTDYEALMTTMIHEVLHSCPGCMTHKGMWKVYANKVSTNTKYHIERCVTAAEQAMVPNYVRPERQTEANKHEITCLHCGKTFRYKRTSTVVKQLLRKPIDSTCTCPYCKGRDFKVVTL